MLQYLNFLIYALWCNGICLIMGSFTTTQEITKLSQHSITLFSRKRTTVLVQDDHAPEFSKHEEFSLISMFQGNISATVYVLFIVKQVIKLEFFS